MEIERLAMKRSELFLSNLLIRRSIMASLECTLLEPSSIIVLVSEEQRHNVSLLRVFFKDARCYFVFPIWGRILF
jgi:hypothetical protein